MRKLIDDVTVEEMRKMRESGMTNMDIARALDVSYPTVHRHLGAQPGRGGRVASTIAAPRFEEVRTEPRKEPVYKGVLPVVNRVTYLTGTTAEYVVDAKKAVVTFAIDDMIAEIPFDRWSEFAEEVAAIQRNLVRQTMTPEIW